jgi:hypothetical protein
MDPTWKARQASLVIAGRVSFAHAASSYNRSISVIVESTADVEGDTRVHHLPKKAHRPVP